MHDGGRERFYVEYHKPVCPVEYEKPIPMARNCGRVRELPHTPS
jgi:hypothetical protein